MNRWGRVEREDETVEPARAATGNESFVTNSGYEQGAQMTYFHDWGFREDPFQTTSLEPNDLGRRLLVGRKRELKKLKQQMRSSGQVSALEGPNGVGKTSLANVAAYCCMVEFEAELVGPLLLPCMRNFQLTAGTNVKDLSTEIFMEVAQTLLRHADLLEKTGRSSKKLANLDVWLNKPTSSSRQGGVGVGTISISGGRDVQATGSVGFERSGLRANVIEILNECFPHGSGAVVVVLDNLELVQTSRTARQLLEELRDVALLIPGLRWVVAGAAGIVSCALTSPRLDGVFSEAISVAGLDPQVATELLSSRLDAFRLHEEEEPYLPLLDEDFGHLSRVLAGNIRSALGRAKEYCESIAVSGKHPETREDKHKTYFDWIYNASGKNLREVENQLTKSTWAVFQKAATELGGVFSPSDFEVFGYNSQQSLRPKVRDLEDTGLLTSALDDSDQRRKTIQVTAKGWFVHFALAERQAGGEAT